MAPLFRIANIVVLFALVNIQPASAQCGITCGTAESNGCCYFTTPSGQKGCSNAVDQGCLNPTVGIAGKQCYSRYCASTGGKCFPGTSLVTLEDGAPKAFKDLEVGDMIMTADRDGVIIASPVIFLPHTKNVIRGKMDCLTTVEGKSLCVTSKHLLPDCGGNLQNVRAFKVGDCVRTIDGTELIASVTKEDTIGIYTAVTTNEFIVADGIVASPFSEADGIAHAFFNQTDVVNWCSTNSHLVHLTDHGNLKDVLGHFQTRVQARNISDVEACVETIEAMYESFKGENIGWGMSGWGYRRFNRVFAST